MHATPHRASSGQSTDPIMIDAGLPAFNYLSSAAPVTITGVPANAVPVSYTSTVMAADPGACGVVTLRGQTSGLPTLVVPFSPTAGTPPALLQTLASGTSASNKITYGYRPLSCWTVRASKTANQFFTQKRVSDESSDWTSFFSHGRFLSIGNRRRGRPATCGRPWMRRGLLLRDLRWSSDGRHTRDHLRRGLDGVQIRRFHAGGSVALLVTYDGLYDGENCGHLCQFLLERSMGRRLCDYPIFSCSQLEDRRHPSPRAGMTGHDDSLRRGSRRRPLSSAPRLLSTSSRSKEGASLEIHGKRLNCPSLRKC